METMEKFQENSTFCLTINTFVLTFLQIQHARNIQPRIITHVEENGRTVTNGMVADEDLLGQGGSLSTGYLRCLPEGQATHLRRRQHHAGPAGKKRLSGTPAVR